jgi:hypothetical protein
MLGHTLPTTCNPIHDLVTTWLDRYGRRAEDTRLPPQEAERIAYAEMVGGDG